MAITSRHRRSATGGGVTRARSQPASTVDNTSASTRTSSRQTVLATGIRSVNPSLAHAAVSRSFTQSATAANVTAPASTAHTATASTLAKEYRTPRGSRGSGTAARTANSPGCSCSVTATGAAQVTGPCGSSTAIGDDDICGCGPCRNYVA